MKTVNFQRTLSFLALAVFIILTTSLSAQKVAPPIPYGPLPSKAQLQWHETEMYAFIHFTINTFTNKEWGYGDVLSDEGMNGHRDGKFWMPAEVDFSIRPGWFWHGSENNKVKSSADLLNHYFRSVGNGINMILNIPPDRRGHVYEKDSVSLVGFGKLISRMYAKNFATGAKVTASNIRGKSSKYSPYLILDKDRIRIIKASACPCISEVGIFAEPEPMTTQATSGKQIQS